MKKWNYLIVFVFLSTSIGTLCFASDAGESCGGSRKPKIEEIKRHQLPYYIKVYNRKTDKPIGYLVGQMADSDDGGFRIVSDIPLLIHSVFQLRIKLPRTVKGGAQYVDFDGLSCWCRPDLRIPTISGGTQPTFDTGFQLLDSTPNFIDLVESLKNYFSFKKSEN